MSAPRVDAELLGSLLGTAIEAGVAAGRLLLGSREAARATITTKSHLNDLVTIADKNAESLIVERIRYDRPHDGILGEEGINENPDASIKWVIDPLDGTTNYLYGCGPYAVSIGVELDGYPIVGVIHCPQTNETFSAALNCGAFVNNERAHASQPESLRTAVLGFDGPTEYHHEQAFRFNRSDYRAVRAIGSCAVAMAWTAAGRFDAFWIRNVAHWDISAGVVIAREAGCWVGGIDGSAPNPRNTLACSPLLTDELLTLLAP